jgi:hypothetical protein
MTPDAVNQNEPPRASPATPSFPPMIVVGRKEFGNACRQIKNLSTFPFSLILLSPPFALSPQGHARRVGRVAIVLVGWVCWRGQTGKRVLHFVSGCGGRPSRPAANRRVIARRWL